jgi:methionine-rich copper-binding protein CopC
VAVRAGALFAVLGLLLLLAKPASAHALLLGTSPAAGARVPHAPATVVLTFDEAVVVPPGAVRVLDGSGANVAQGAAFHPDGVGARVAVRSARLQPGRYVVAWRVVSDDGHIVSGAFAFGIGEDAGDVPATVVQAQVPGAAAILAVLHFCLLAGILVGAGLFAGALLAARPGATIAPSLLGFTAWSVIGFVAFMQLFVQADFAGLPIAAVLTTRYGVLRIVLIGAAIVGFRSFLVERGSTALLAAASVVAILAEAFAGHAATGMLPALGVAADVVHLAGAALWIGVLLVTLSAPRGVDVVRRRNRRERGTAGATQHPVVRGAHRHGIWAVGVREDRLAAPRARLRGRVAPARAGRKRGGRPQRAHRSGGADRRARRDGRARRRAAAAQGRRGPSRRTHVRGRRSPRDRGGERRRRPAPHDPHPHDASRRTGKRRRR